MVTTSRTQFIATKCEDSLIISLVEWCVEVHSILHIELYIGESRHGFYMTQYTMRIYSIWQTIAIYEGDSILERKSYQLIEITILSI